MNDSIISCCRILSISPFVNSFILFFRIKHRKRFKSCTFSILRQNQIQSIEAIRVFRPFLAVLHIILQLRFILFIRNQSFQSHIEFVTNHFIGKLEEIICGIRIFSIFTVFFSFDKVGTHMIILPILMQCADLLVCQPHLIFQFFVGFSGKVRIQKIRICLQIYGENLYFVFFRICKL